MHFWQPAKIWKLLRLYSFESLQNNAHLIACKVVIIEQYKNERQLNKHVRNQMAPGLTESEATQNA